MQKLIFHLSDSGARLTLSTESIEKKMRDEHLVEWARKEAHRYFDRLWKGKDAVYTRKQAYIWLSQELDINGKEAHFSKLGTDQCLMIVSTIKRRFVAR